MIARWFLEHHGRRGMDGLLATGKNLDKHILVVESAARRLRFRLFRCLPKPGDMIKTRSCPLLRPDASHIETPMQHLTRNAAGARSGRNLA